MNEEIDILQVHNRIHRLFGFDVMDISCEIGNHDGNHMLFTWNNIEMRIPLQFCLSDESLTTWMKDYLSVKAVAALIFHKGMVDALENNLSYESRESHKWHIGVSFTITQSGVYKVSAERSGQIHPLASRLYNQDDRLVLAYSSQKLCTFVNLEAHKTYCIQYYDKLVPFKWAVELLGDK